MTLTTRSIVARLMMAWLALVPAAASAQQAASGQQASRSGVRPNGPAALGVHGFSVVLVVGSLSGTVTTAANDGVPEAARKALADMKDFLPYKRYQLVDAAWMLCCASPRSAVSGVMNGPDSREYRYEVDPIGVSDTKLDVRFTIRETKESVASPSGRTPTHPAEIEHSRQMAAAVREREDAQRDLAAAQELRRKGLITASDMEAKVTRSRQAEQRVRELRATGPAVLAQKMVSQNIIDSTFSMSLGETVVVGTSRLHGDRALIAILTAASKPTPSATR